MSRSTMEWAMEQEEIARSRKLRDQAALAALQGILATVSRINPNVEFKGETTAQLWSRQAWAIADAFVAARGDTPEEEIK